MGRDQKFIFDKKPSIGPNFLNNFLHGLTYDEAHAALLGLVGFVAGAGVVAGYTATVAIFTIIVIAWVFGLVPIANKILPWDISEVGGKSKKIIIKEPWYFFVVYAVTLNLTIIFAPIFL